MTSIHCHIGGRDYRLDYDTTPITTGVIYRGTVYLDHLLDFCCEIPYQHGECLFYPNEIGAPVRKAVLEAISAHKSLQI